MDLRRLRCWLQPRRWTRDFGYIRDRDERDAAVEFAWSQILEQAANLTSVDVVVPENSRNDDDSAQEPPTKRARGEHLLLSFFTGTHERNISTFYKI